MNTSGVWDPSLGLPSRKAWLSFQTNTKSGPAGKPLPGATPLGTKPRVAVGPSPLAANSHALTPSQSRGRLLTLAKQPSIRLPTLELPRVSSRRTILRSGRPRTLVRGTLKPLPAVTLLVPSKPSGTSNQVCPDIPFLRASRRSWFPPPVAFDIKQAGDVSMPSTETQGQQPGERTGGVGSLPGSKEEQDVAVLPEERATKTTETDHQERRDEPGAPPDESKRPTDTGIGGATDPLQRDTQSKVCTCFGLCM